MTHTTSKKRNSQRDFNNLFDAGFFPWGGIGDSKAPYGNGWQRFGQKLPTDSRIDELLDMNLTHVGIILPSRFIRKGEYAKITVLDCECEEVGDEVLDLIAKICPELEDKIAVRKNRKSGGVHVFVQHPVDTQFSKIRLYDRKIKLKKPGHENDSESDKAPLVFETLGTDKGAKYCIVYAEGREYIYENRLEDIQTLTPSEMKKMERVLERLAELHPTESKSTTKKTPKKKGRKQIADDLDFDDLDSNFDVREMLEEAGWAFEHEDEEQWYYTRPGKRSGTSASVLKEKQLLYVFTSSTEFTKDETYTPFQVYALLEHGVDKGDSYKKVVKALKKQWYKDAVSHIEKKTELVLPSMEQTISACAEQAFGRFAETKELFYRGGKVQEIIRSNGDDCLEVVRPERFCSLLERPFSLMKWQDGSDGPKKKSAHCSKADAERLLVTDAARELLPEITILSACPILSPDGRVIQHGYDPETKCYVLDDLEVIIPPLEKAVKWLKRLLHDFNFHSGGDRSRAIAALLTPGLTFGGFLKRTPLTVLEADKSQTGKGYFVRANATLYGEQAHLVVRRDGGVGGFDESLATRLAAGNPFINIDNLRGRLDSQYLEAFLTAEGLFSVRLPYKGEMQIDSRQFCLYGTSNAVELTRDTANRMSIIRLRKRPARYRFKKWDEGDLVEHIAAKRQHILGAVFAVLQAWIEEGKPRTEETRHDFREWTQSLDWIVQNIFDEVPLMDGFIEAKERITNSSLSFIRQLGVVVEKCHKLHVPLSASELYTLCEEHGIDVPNFRADDENAGRLQIGKIFGNNFGKAERLDVDEYLVIRNKGEVQREDGRGLRKISRYAFYKADENGAGA